jgi:beta-mannanase
MINKYYLISSLLTAALLNGCNSDTTTQPNNNVQPHKIKRQTVQSQVGEMQFTIKNKNTKACTFSFYTNSLKHKQIFLDTDKNNHTGYSSWETTGIGAEYLIEDGNLFKYIGDNDWDIVKWAEDDVSKVDIAFSDLNNANAFDAKVVLLSDNWELEESSIVMHYASNQGGVITHFKLKKPEDDKIYFAAYPDFGDQEDSADVEKIREFENLAGKNIAWAYISNQWKDGIKYPKSLIHTIQNSGVTPFVRMVPRSDNDVTSDVEKADDLYTMQNIIDGKFDTALRAWAKDAKKDNIPLLVDFGVEMTGFWFPWSGLYNGGSKTDGYGDPNYPDGPERYRDAYRHIIDIFKSEKVYNITWFFHPDIQRLPNQEWNSAKYYYPGDDYIDWIGLSIYGPQFNDESWKYFSKSIEEGYKYINDITDNKPIAILEFGVTDFRNDGTKSDWFEDAFETIKDNPYIKFSALTYWHESWTNEDESKTTLKIDSSEDSLETFRELISDDTFISKTKFN